MDYTFISNYVRINEKRIPDERNLWKCVEKKEMFLQRKLNLSMETRIFDLINFKIDDTHDDVLGNVSIEWPGAMAIIEISYDQLSCLIGRIGEVHYMRVNIRISIMATILILHCLVSHSDLNNYRTCRFLVRIPSMLRLLVVQLHSRPIWWRGEHFSLLKI